MINGFYADTKKRFSLSAMTGCGADGSREEMELPLWLRAYYPSGGRSDLATYAERDFIPIDFENPDANRGLLQEDLNQNITTSALVLSALSLYPSLPGNDCRSFPR